MFHFFQVIGRLPSSPGSEGKINGPPGRRGAADAAGCLKMDRPWGRRVLKFDSPCRAEGCGGALRADIPCDVCHLII